MNGIEIEPEWRQEFERAEDDLPAPPLVLVLEFRPPRPRWHRLVPFVLIFIALVSTLVRLVGG